MMIGDDKEVGRGWGAPMTDPLSADRPFICLTLLDRFKLLLR